MASNRITSRRGARNWAAAASLFAAVIVLHPERAAPAVPAAATVSVTSPASLAQPVGARELVIRYRAHNGVIRNAYVRVPTWYGKRRSPALPLIISPHGRARTGQSNARLWADLPSVGGFAVVSPDGQGERLPTMSWGARGQIDDLARMPRIVEQALPWLHIDHARIYAFGGSMGGHETLLLAARYPTLLAGAASIDGVTDFALQYENFPDLGCNAACRRMWHGRIGVSLQAFAREELGGSPATAAAAYAERSPLSFVRALAWSCVPLQIWWSRKDKIVRQSELQSGRLFELIRMANPAAPVEAYRGNWIHTAAFKATTRLPFALERFGLMRPAFGVKPIELERVDAGADPARRAKGC
jgi:pimeloyl-ACP methyl ester carboxylesterase